MTRSSSRRVAIRKANKMGDETKQIQVPEELLHKIEVSNLKVGKANAELVAANQAVQLAQIAAQNANLDAQKLQERVTVEITDRGAWEVIHDDGKGNMTLKLTEIGKQRRVKEAEEKAEKDKPLADVSA